MTTRLARLATVVALFVFSVVFSASAMAAKPNATAGTCTVPRARPYRTYYYYMAMTDALRQAKAARDQSVTALNAGVSPTQSAPALLVALQSSEAGYRCAASYVEPYAKSNNRAISVSASGLTTSLHQLAGLENYVEQHTNDFLNGPGLDAPAGTRAPESADFTVKVNDAWDLLSMSVQVSSDAALSFNKSGKTGRMLLPASARAAVLTRLRAIAPSAEQQNDQSPALEAAVGKLIRILKDPRWRASDNHGAQ